MNKSWFRIALSVFLIAGAVGAVVAFGSFDWKLFAQALGAFHPGWMACALGMSLVQISFQMLRFGVAFGPGQVTNYFGLLRTTAEGQFLNSVTPLRSGDAYKAIRLAQLGVAAGVAVAAVFGERLADNLALLALAAFASAPTLTGLIFRIAHSPWPLPMGGAACVGLAVCAGLYRGSGVPKRFKKMAGVVSRFLGRMGRFFRSRSFVLCVIVAAAAWLCDVGTLVLSARAGDVQLTLKQAMASIFILNLGVAVPLTVANVGIYEASLGFALTKLGLSVEQGLSIATVQHAVTLCGLVSFNGIVLLISPLFSTPKPPGRRHAR